ncbi:hypothetical protein OG730_04420 [Streptomyces sp. NBC_01298]|nr:hypothetical protein OG730_04420 [Streptomyces sp. NBC_01298]
MTAYSFGNRWVGISALKEPPEAPSMQDLAKRQAARIEAGTPRKPTKKKRRRQGQEAHHPSIDLGNGVLVNAPRVRRALRDMATAMNRAGRGTDASQLLAVHDSLLVPNPVIHSEDLKRALRTGFAPGR